MSENLEAAAVGQEVAVVDTEVEAEDVEVQAEVTEVEVEETAPPSPEASEVLAAPDEVIEVAEVEITEVQAEVAEVEVEETASPGPEASEVLAAPDEAIEVAEVEVVEVQAEVAEVEVEETPPPSPEASEAPAEADAAKVEADKSDGKAETSERVVRVLSVGMEVDGVVKRTTDFGAFVDIGVGRDGLIHISELSARRVAKVSDVVKEGQAVTAWIKELDRSRNRISLTLIAPGTKTIRDLQKDELVTGTVTRIVPYGAFLDIGVGRDALLHIREMADGYVNKPEDVVQVGETVEARIIEVSRRRGRIDLSLKGLGPEEEPEAEVVAEAETEEELDDPFENLEVLSPMELAFQRAMSEDNEEVEGVTRKRTKRTRREQIRSMQDEIISRTLKDSDRG